MTIRLLDVCGSRLKCFMSGEMRLAHDKQEQEYGTSNLTVKGNGESFGNGFEYDCFLL